MSRPVAALGAVCAVGVAIPFSSPFALVALWPIFLIARSGGARRAAGAVALVCAAAVVHDLVWPTEIEPVGLLFSLVLCGAAVGFGLYAGARDQAAARERALLADRAAAEERLRIARELHDAVGHDVSLMVVQAQALGVTSDDEQVRAGADAIAALGRRTMGEMHRTLRLLRDDPTRAPEPTLAAIGDVLAGVRAAGVPLSYAVEGAPRQLTPALDAAAHRIVQEAVTNVVRHAGGAAAAVTVRYGPDALELLIGDDGPGADANANGGGGHGLVGMRERAALFGGTLEAGPRAGAAGFVVRARLPYEEPA